MIRSKGVRLVNSKFGTTLTPLAAAVSAALAPAGSAQAQDEGALMIEEIIVTATKREQNLQDIAGSVQAIPQSVLERMGAKALEDYTRFIPSVNVVNYSPGASNIVFRGVTTAGGDNTGSNAIGQSPASLYLDEMSLTTTGTQPEVRMVDINRIEALAGPQGTLYGAAAQSGTLRIITNQPDPSGFEAVLDVTLKTGSDAAPSHDVSLVLNLPFADGKAALRLVGYTATDGGFIDNVFGHTPDTHDHHTANNATGKLWAMSPEWGTADNAAVVEEDWNEVDYTGGRITLRYEFNDEWAATVGAVFQNAEGKASNHFDPFVGDLQVVKFNDEIHDDEWTSFQLTVEGDLGWAQLVSATSYFDRTIFRIEDATVYIKYYQGWACNYQLDPTVYTGYWPDPVSGTASYGARYCFGPSLLSDTLIVQEFNSYADKFTQEFRLSGGGDNLNWIVGLFYETTNDDWDSPWGRATNFDYQDSIALQYWEASFGAGIAPNAQQGWHSFSKVDWDQKAIFGELTWHINDQWTANVGARWFDRTMASEYYVENPNTLRSAADLQGGNIFAEGGSEDFVPKVSLSYQVSDDKMVYALYSEGVRPGGINRGRGDPVLPVVFEPDTLQNIEIGAKTRWANGRVQANLTFFDMEWEDYQLQVVDPSYDLGDPWQQVVFNAGDASVTGVQFDLDVVVTEGLRFGMNLTSLEAETTTDVTISIISPDTDIPAGSRLPHTPEFKASAWLDYNWETNFIPGKAFARLQYSHTGDSLNQIQPTAPSGSGAGAANPQVLSPSFGIADFRIGLVTDADWEISFFVSNLTDERAQYTWSSRYFENAWSSVEDGRDGWARIQTNRPREYGIRFTKRWTN